MSYKPWWDLVSDPGGIRASGSGTAGTSDDAHLSALALNLHLNHLRKSLPTALRPRLPESLSLPDTTRDYRAIAVVGAGASYPLLRVARDLADDFIRTHETDRDGYAEELKRLVLAKNLDRDDFETRISAFARTSHGEKRARQNLAMRHAFRHPTLLDYELLAHLLKHRYLDAIISFNFDELLDQSLEDELGEGEFVQIVSERDLRKLTRFPGDDDYIPAYIKIHGTASDRAA